MKASDIEAGLDQFFKSQDSTEAQRADAPLVLKSQCEMVGDEVYLKPTGEPLDSDKSREWIVKNKPHLLPPVYSESLADRAFVANDKTARGALVKEVGKAEADKIAERYGLDSVTDFRRGKAPERADAGGDKTKNAAKHKSNPFHKSAWNLTAQSRLLRAVGVEKCAAIARAVGAKIGDTRPNPDF